MHFLLIGLVLFGANALIQGPQQDRTGGDIVISEGQVGQIADSYVLLAGRAPSRAELEALVDDYVTEEISYREAVAMGLDAGDTIIRRRLRQKLEFLLEDASSSAEPTETELAAWLAEHAVAYRLPERRAMRQVLASSDRRGPKAAADAHAFLARLESGADPAKLGDPSMLPTVMPLTTEEGAAGLFGAEFAASVFEHAGEGWFGPVASPFGQHIVQVIGTEPGRSAALDDIRDKIRADVIESRRDRSRDEFHARMRQRYSIRINWPEPYRGLPEAPNPAPKTKPAPPEVSE